MSLEIHNYFAAFEGNDKAICSHLQQVISTTLPQLESKIWHGHPVWFDNGNPIVGFSKLKGCIRLLFWSGQSFDEPGLQNEGKFKAAEKRFTFLNEINSDDIKRWCTKAQDIQWDYKNIVKRKGVLLPLKGIQ